MVSPFIFSRVEPFDPHQARLRPAGEQSSPNMDILFLLVPLSVVLALLIGAAFWMAIEGGQFEDLERHGLSVPADDDRPAREP
jgi:cbb3-type cytochrome oxidase maturation protein